jgi:hypothetical protein
MASFIFGNDERPQARLRNEHHWPREGQEDSMGLIVRVHAIQRLARIASPAPSRNRLASSFRSGLVCQQTEYPYGESNDVKGLAGYQQGLVVSNAIHFFKKGYAHSSRLLPTPSTEDLLSDVMKARVRKDPMVIDPFGRIAPPKVFNLFFM